MIQLVSKEKRQCIENAVDYYLQHDITVKDCAKKYGIHRVTLGKYISQRDSEINTRRKFDIDDNFFDVIDTEEKAYTLGFFTADGCIRVKRKDMKISLNQKDRYILEAMQTAMNDKHPIKDYHITTNYGTTDISEWVFASHRIFKRLKEFGFENKTAHECFCEEIPKEMIRHYIRGIFDGDGWFSYTPIHSTKELGFGMGKQILESIRDTFIKDVGINEKYKVFPYKSIYRFRITSTEDVIKIFHYFYDNATIFLNRKHDKMLSFCRSKMSPRESSNDQDGIKLE